MSQAEMGYACPSCGKDLPEGAFCVSCGLMAQAAKGSLALRRDSGGGGSLGVGLSDGSDRSDGADGSGVLLVPPPPPLPTLGRESDLSARSVGSVGFVGFPAPEVPIPPPPGTPMAVSPLPTWRAAPAPPAPPPAPAPPAAPRSGPLQEFLGQGFEIFLLAGLSGAGKTHLMETFRGQDTTSKVVRGSDGLVLSTRPFGFDIHPFPHGKRRAIFVDASGEQYKKLYAVADQAQGKEELELLQQVSGGLGGLILLLNLHDLWSGLGSAPLQPRALANVLRLLRWLRGGGRLESGEQRSLPQRVDSEVERMPRLKVPVLLLFSMADHLHGHELPAPKSGAPQPGRRIFPPGEDPLLILHHYVPELFQALEKHVHCFHVDFCHSVVTDPASGKVVEENACGVALAKDWLLEASGRLPFLSTHFWLALDRRLHPSRWATLPPSLPLAPQGGG